MKVENIRAKVKEVISSVANIPVEKIGDSDSYQKDLGLDSLSLLEIGVDIDYEFQLGLPEEEWQDIDSVAAAVQLVSRHRAEQAA